MEFLSITSYSTQGLDAWTIMIKISDTKTLFATPPHYTKTKCIIKLLVIPINQCYRATVPPMVKAYNHINNPTVAYQYPAVLGKTPTENSQQNTTNLAKKTIYCLHFSGLKSQVAVPHTMASVCTLVWDKQ